jgi:spermidine synthase
LGLVGCWMLLLIAFASGGSPHQNRWLHLLSEWLFRGLEIGIVLLSVILFFHVRNSSATVQWSSRDFFGVSWVKEVNADVPADHAHALVHNGTVHGFQYVDEEKRLLPTAYYTEESGMGLAILHHPRRDAGLRVGGVGLGVGTLAAYGRPGDTIRFYEINPDVMRLAEGEGGYFTYLRDCAAQVVVVPGDARVSMERELTEGDPGRFDLLVVDAFNSGSPPVHLLTREAFDIYLGHLQPDGIMALHISNRYMDLRPVVQELADHLQLDTMFIVNDGGGSGRGYWSAWMLVTRSEQFLEQPEIAGQGSPQRVVEGFRLWTDDYSSVLPTLLTGGALAEGLLGDSESPRDIGGGD